MNRESPKRFISEAEVAIDFQELEQRLTAHFGLGPRSDHGPEHWHRVKENGLKIAPTNGADEVVVHLFALFHDSCRQSEGYDPKHGHRAAELAAQVDGDWFAISEDQLELLQYASRLHNDGETTDDPTIGACWDGDRLDLTRVNKIPDPAYLSTKAGIRLALHGNFDDMLNSVSLEDLIDKN